MEILAHKAFQKICPICNTEFTVENNAQIYCSHPCRTRRQSSKKQDADWRKKPKTCKQCGKEFLIPEGSSPIRTYCSTDCQIIGYKRNEQKFREENPKSMHYYNARRYAKHGKTDKLITRLYKKYADLPKCCEVPGCAEGRVIDLAHKPEFKRNGAHRVMKHYQRHMFWILCPTHHAIIDRGVLVPAQIGLIE